MNLRRFAAIAILGGSMLIGGAVITKAQTIVFEPGRYRMNYRGYRTNERGAQLLRDAVNRGYQAGYQAGVADRDGRRRMNWNRNEHYRSGNLGYESSVGQSYYRYYFQQGFRRGYQDGFYSRNTYGDGTNILGNILTSIFRATRY